MSKVCLLLLILNFVGMVSCMEQPPKQSRKQQGHQERLVKREVDLITKYDHKIREYYRELAEVGLGWGHGNAYRQESGVYRSCSRIEFRNP